MKSLTSKSVVKVADLGITLYPGQTTWVEDEDFNSSQCLRALCSMGKVEVMSKDRHKTMRSQTSSRTNRAARKFKPKVPHSQAPQVLPSPPEPTITRREAEIRASEAARKAAEEAARMAISAVMPLIQEIKDTVSTQSPVEGIDSKIENAVSRAIEGASFVATEGQQPISTRRRPPAAEEPIFIPKGIIKEDSEVLSVNSSSSEDGELDSAVAALKALKKK